MKNRWLNMLLMPILVAFILSGCSKKEEAPPVPKTGVELIAIGPILFGGVLVGDFRDAAVRIINYGPEAINTTEIRNLLLPPFNVQSVSNPCATGSLPMGQSCVISVRFTPIEAGEFSQEIRIGNSSLLTSGRGLLGGAISLSETYWEPGVTVAGVELRKSITVTNLGDFTVPAPQVQLVPGVSIGVYTCGSFIASRKTCRIELVVKKLIAGQLSEDIYFNAQDGGNPFVTLVSNTIPAEPAGSINFLSPPASIVADGVSEREITTDFIRDQFGNIVSDGTSVRISSTNVTMLTSTPQTTVGGKITFRVRASQTKGFSTVSLLSAEASGFLRMRATSGPAFGAIQVEPYASQITANGQTQIVFKLRTLVDQFGNVVEDNSEIYYSIANGGGTLNKSFGFSVLGSDTVILTSPTSVGTAVLQIRSGPIYDVNGVLTGYSASGDFPVGYVPGLAAGNIPINASFSGIYAIEDQTIENEGTPIRSNVSIGPVRDANGNIVVGGTALSLSVTGGINITHGLDNPATVYTDAGGMINFIVAGNGNRGEIKINVSGGANAVGNYTIWAFKDERITADNTENNRVLIYEKYFAANSLPPLATNWAQSVDVAKTSIADGTLFGARHLNRSGARAYQNALDYLRYPCWFGGKNDRIYVGPCLRDNFVNMSAAYLNGSADVLTLSTPDRLQGIPVDRPFSSVHPAIYQYPNIGYNSQLDRYMIFGGYYYEAITNAFGTTYLGHSTKNASYYNGLTREGAAATSTSQTGQEDPEDIGDYPPSMANGAIAAKDNLMYMFGGFNPLGPDGTLYNQLYIYNGSTAKWSSPLIDPDENELGTSGEPEARQQNGMAYVPQTNTLYIMGGVKNYLCSEFLTKGRCNSFNACTWDDRDAGGVNNASGLPISESAVGEFCQPLSDSTCSNIFLTSALYGGQAQTECNKRAGCFWETGTSSCKRRSDAPNGEGMGITDADDLWALNLTPNSEGALTWKKICGSEKPYLGSNTNVPNPAYGSCGFPTSGVAGKPFSGSPVYRDTRSGARQEPKNIHAVWNDIRQKLYIYWSEHPAVKVFDPYSNTLATPVDGSQTLSGAYQVFYNSRLGRMFGYYRGGVNQVNSTLKVWESEGNEKKFYRISINIGAGAKDFVQSLKPILRAGGETSGSAAPNVGVELYIYNFGTNSWEQVGFNGLSASGASSITFNGQQQILRQYIGGGVSDYVSTAGRAELLVTPRGNPNNTGSNEIWIDSFALEGRF